MSEDKTLIILTASIISAHVGNNNLASTEVIELIDAVYRALSKLEDKSTTSDPITVPGAVTLRKSLNNPAHILSMIDGKPYKMLRRHIAHHGYTPESYCDAFGLPKDYPMVARGYTEIRRQLAFKTGLGHVSASRSVTVNEVKGSRPK